MSLKVQAEHLLIIKIAALGDLCMTAPMAAELKRRNPQTQLTWIVGKSTSTLLAEFKLADEIIEIDDAALLTGSFGQKLWVLLKTAWRLKGRSFTVAYNLHQDKRYWWLLLASKVLKKVQYKTIPGRHHADSFLFLLEDERGPLVTKAPAFKLDRGLKRGSLIGLAPGGAKNVARENSLRRWPIEHYHQLAKDLISQGHSVVVIGARSDDWVQPYFHDLPLHFEIGTLNVPKLLDYLSTLQLLVTHDSGPLHLAHLVSTPVFAAFGPTPASSFYPQTNAGQVFELSPKLTCQPCYDGKDYPTCRDNECLKKILPSRIQLGIDSFLTAAKGL